MVDLRRVLPEDPVYQTNGVNRMEVRVIVTRP